MKSNIYTLMLSIVLITNITVHSQTLNFDLVDHTKIIEVSGESFPVVDFGEGTPVILLHGFPDSKELWINQVPALAEAGYRVIAPDLRGYGNAPRPLDKESYALGNIMNDVIGLMNALQIDSAHLVGHDWGAGLGWLLANYFEHRFISYTPLSVGTAGTSAWNSIEQREKAWYYYFFLQEGLAEKALTKDDWLLFKQMVGSHKNIDDIIDRMSEPDALSTALNWYRGNFTHLQHDNKETYLGDGSYFTTMDKKINIPVLAIWSEYDPFLLEPQMRQSEQSVAGKFIYKKIKGAGHWMMLDRPQKLNNMLIEFYKSLAN